MKKLTIVFIAAIIGGISGYLITRQWLTKPCEEQVFGKPIPLDLEDILLANGALPTSLFKLKAGSVPVEANKWTINMTDWVNFLNLLAETNDSIMIYPAMVEGDNSIHYLLTSIPGELGSFERDYYLINKDYGYQAFPGNKPLSKAEAEVYYKAYNKNIDGSIENGVLDDENKPSRVYSAKELIIFLRMNGVKKDKPEEYKDWSFAIKGSVINAYIADEIQTYWPEENSKITKEDQKGFTAMFKVYDQYGKSNSAFEIGKPCPPRCGELSW